MIITMLIILNVLIVVMIFRLGAGYKSSIFMSAHRNASIWHNIKNCQVLKVGIECLIRFLVLFTCSLTYSCSLILEFPDFEE